MTSVLCIYRLRPVSGASPGYSGAGCIRTKKGSPMTDRIAFFTYGVLKQPIGHPEVQGFIDRVESVYGAAEGSLGFFARSERNVQTWEHSWGPVIAPQCTPQGATLNELAMALSLWRDLESVAAFAYRGAHGEALSKRKEWFRSGDWPTYVAWWVNENHKPN